MTPAAQRHLWCLGQARHHGVLAVNVVRHEQDAIAAPYFAYDYARIAGHFAGIVLDEWIAPAREATELNYEFVYAMLASDWGERVDVDTTAYDSQEER